MTYLPTNVFKNIMEYCDDRVERQQKTHRKRCMTQIERLPNNWYWNYMSNLYWETFDDEDFETPDTTDEERYIYYLNNDFPGQFNFTDMSDTAISTMENIIFGKDFTDYQFINVDNIEVVLSGDEYEIPIEEAVWIDFEGYKRVPSRQQP